MDWYQAAWRNAFGDDELSHALLIATIATWTFPLFMAAFAVADIADHIGNILRGDQ
jgi:hypothetical protein